MENNTILKDDTSILNEIKLFYKKLYTNESRLEYGTSAEKFLNLKHAKLTQTESDQCDDEISEQECLCALKTLSNGKTPGSDGFPAEFYKVFWQDIKESLIESFLCTFRKNELSIDQNWGIEYLKGRYIGDNIRTVTDLIAYLNNKNMEGILMLIDFEKAFLSVNWTFILDTLKNFNFGPKFQKWVGIMYNNI